MRGNNKPARGLFSGMKRTVVASAAALSLAIGGMAVPAIPTPAGDSLLPTASAQWTDADVPDLVDPLKELHKTQANKLAGNTSASFENVDPLANYNENWAQAPEELRQLSQNGQTGYRVEILGNDSKEIRLHGVELYGPLVLKKDKYKRDYYGPGQQSRAFEKGDYYVWVDEARAGEYRVLGDDQNRVFKVKATTTQDKEYGAEGYGNGLRLEFPRELTIPKSASGSNVRLNIFRPGPGGPQLKRLNNYVKHLTEPQRAVLNGVVKGAPADGADVLVDGQKMGTVSGGKFSIADLEPGSHRIEIDATPTTNKTPAQTKNLTAGANEITFTVEEKHGTVKGRVSAPDSYTSNIRIDLLDGNDNVVKSTSRRPGQVFSLDAPAGEYTLKAEAVDKTRPYAPDEVTVTLKPGETSTKDLEINAHTANYLGKVEDEQGNAVDNAKITLTHTETGQTFEGETGTDGRFNIGDIAEGEYTVTVSGTTSTEGQDLPNVTFKSGDRINEEPFVVKLKRRSVSGVVTDRETGNAVGNATVTLGDNGPTTTTGDDGSYTFTKVLPGNYTVHAKSDTYGRGSANALVVATGDSTGNNVEIGWKNGNLEVTATYYGTDKEPAEGIDVFVYKGSEQVGSKKTGPDGKVRFEDLKVGDYKIHFAETKTTKKSDPYEVKVDEGQTKSLTGLVVYKPATIAGNVTVDGEQKSGVEVFIDGPNGTVSTKTNEQGRYTYTVDDVTPGNYTARIAGTDRYPEKSATVTLDGGEEKLNVRIDAETYPGSVTGRVVDEDGNPIKGASVTVGSKKVQTDEQGIFTAEDLKRSAAKNVTVTVLGGDTYGEVVREGQVEILPAETKDIGDIKVQRNPGSIAGTVTNDAGTPLASGTAYISGAEDFSTQATITNGKYEVTGLKPGEYTVSVGEKSLTDAAEKKVVVESGKNANGDIQVRRFLGTYRVTVFDDLNKEIQGASITLTGAGFSRTETTNAEGVATFDNVPPGKYEYVVAGADEYVKAAGYPDEMGQDETIAFNVVVQPTDGRVTGTVRDDAGTALSGVEVQIRGNLRVDESKTFETTATTDENGRYDFADVPPGDYTITTEPSKAYKAGNAEASVRPNQSAEGNITRVRNDGVLGGTVTNDNGEKVDGATVLLKSADGGKEIDRTTASAEGVYEFTGVRPDEYVLEVVGAKEYGGVTATAQVNAGDRSTKDLRVSRSAGAINGTVVDETGEGVEGAEVTIVGMDGTYTTDANGEFVVDAVAPGTYTAKVAAADHSAASGVVLVDPGATATLELTVNRNKATVNGVVFDDAGQPVDGVDVEIVDSNGQPAVDVNGNDVSQTTTDDQGGFTVSDLAPGDYSASVADAQTHEPGNAAFTVTENEFTDLVEITVPRKSGTLNGRITDADDAEKGITNATLTLIRDGEDAGKSIAVRADGTFEQSFPAGKYTLQVESPQYYAPYSEKTVTVPAGNSVTQNIELVSTVGSLAGSVTDEDGNALRTTVSIRNLQNSVSRDVETNENGDYAVGNLEVGAYRVTVAAPEGFDVTESQDVEVARSQSTSADFVLPKAPETHQEGSVSGEVRADDGSTVEGVNVNLKNRETEKVYEATIDEDGRFTATGLPAGDYDVIVGVDGYKATSTPRATVSAGENTEIGRITIVKDETPQGTYRGVARDADSHEPIRGVKLVVSGDNGERVFDTDAKGEAFGKLPVGKYSVTATPAADSDYLPSSKPSAFEIKANERTEVFSDLDRKPAEQEKSTTGTVTGSIRDQNGDPVEGTTAELRGEDGTTIDLEVDENGDFNLPEVPEGEYTVVVTPGDGHRTPRYQEIEVTPGESTDVGRITTPTKKKQLDESDKGKPGTINGWLVDDMNEPIPGATVVITGKGTDTDADGNPIDTYPAVTVDPDGRFTTDELPEGEYEIDLELPEGWDKPEGWPKSVTVTKDEPQHQGVINVEAPRSEIKGAVVDGKGNPIDGVVVTVTDSHGDTKEVPVDENGEYALDVVPGDAVVEVFTPEDVQDVDPMYIPVRPKVDVELPTVNLTEKTLKLQKRVLGWDADSPEDAPGLPKDEKLVYGFIVTNESDEKVTKVQIEDPFADASIKAPEGFDGSIEPGDHVVFSAVMDAPYDSGAFANIAVARGLAQDGSMIASTPNEAYVTFMDMSLKKKVNAQFASNAKDPVKMAADRDLYFTYEVVNTGSVRMENVAVRDTIYEGDEKDFNPDNPGKGTPMEIIAPEGFTGTLMPGERAVFKGILPPLKPGTRHHNAAEASGEAPEPPKRSKIFEDEPDYGDDPSGLLVVSPKENIDGNAHIVVEEGAPLPAITDINGSLYVDVNEDGKRDEGDKPYGGMEVTLHSADGLPAVTETSDSNGEFVFKGVNAGNYTLQMRNPGGVILAEPLDEEKNDNGIGATLESKEFEVTGDEETLDKEILLLDRPIEIPEEPTPTPEPAPEGSSLGKCISETSSVSNPATWLIPIGILIAAMGGAAVLFEDQFNAAAAEFNKAMPSLNIQRPEWMNQISRQLAEIDPAVPAVALAVGIIALGALVLGLTYASCETGKDFGSSNGEGSSSKDGGSSSKDEETAGPTEPAEESEESEDSEDKLTTAAVPAE